MLNTLGYRIFVASFTMLGVLGYISRAHAEIPQVDSDVGVVDFGVLHTGVSGSLTKVVTFTNKGPNTITAKFSIADADKGFSVSPADGSLAPGQPFPVTVTSQLLPGKLTSTLQAAFLSSTMTKGTAELPIKQEVGDQGPVLKIVQADGKSLNSGDTISFTFPYIGTETYGSQQLTLQNSGTQDLVIQKLELSDDPSNAAFRFEQAPVLPMTIAAGASTTVTIRFAPQIAGTFQGKLTLTSNHLGLAGTTYEAKLSGTRDQTRLGGGGWDAGGGCVANMVAGHSNHGGGSFYLLALLVLTLVSTRMIRTHRKTSR